MKAELEAPGPRRGVKLIAETEEDVQVLERLWGCKVRVMAYWNQGNLTIAPTTETERML